MLPPESATNTHPSPPPTSGQEEVATTAPDTPRRQAGVTPPLLRSQPTHDWDSTSEDSYNSMQADDADDSIMINAEISHGGSGLPTAARTKVTANLKPHLEDGPRQRTVSAHRERLVSNLVAPMRGRAGSFARHSLDKLSNALGGGPGSIRVARQAPAQGGAAKTQGAAAKPGPPARSHVSHYTNTHETMHAPKRATASGSTTKGSRMSTPLYASSYATQHQGRTPLGATPSSKPVSKAGTYATIGESGGSVKESRKPKEKEDKRRLSKRAAAAAAGAAETGAAIGAAITTWL